jgi:hypothetical protein
MRFLISLGLLFFASRYALAQSDPASEGLEERMIVAPLPRGGDIRGLISKKPGSNPQHVALIFVGAPGILRLTEESGVFKYRMKGNFLSRARRHLVDDHIMTVLVDCPTDELDSCTPLYRSKPVHVEDVRTLIDALSRELGQVSFTVIGTSMGTVSSAHLARGLGPMLKGAIHTATFAGVHRYTWESGMSGFDWKLARTAQLFVHHEDDPCHVTPYRDLKNAIDNLPLITVVGSQGVNGPPCEAQSQHGFKGRERETMRAIADWISNGKAMHRVGEP